MSLYICSTLKGLFLIIVFLKKYDCERKITLPDLSFVKCTASLLFRLGFEYV